MSCHLPSMKLTRHSNYVIEYHWAAEIEISM